MHQLLPAEFSAEREVAGELWSRGETLRVLSRLNRAGVRERAEGFRFQRQRNDPFCGGQAPGIPQGEAEEKE
jgi:hypothetical protein